MDKAKPFSAPTLLAAYNLSPNKNRGQNFLADPATARSLAGLSGATAADTVVEIGSGLGALTLPLSQMAKKVWAVEPDRRLVPVLQRQLDHAGAGNVEILEADFLKLDLSRLAPPEGGPMLAVGNLPYQISSQIMFRLLENKPLFRGAMLMFQRELAERIISGPGSKSYGRISVMAQYCSKIRIVSTLGPEKFHPRPQVVSQVLEFDFSQKPPVEVLSLELFSRVVRAAFSTRRKTIKNCLSRKKLSPDSSFPVQWLEQAGINPVDRAEVIPVEQYVLLTNLIHEKTFSPDS